MVSIISKSTTQTKNIGELLSKYLKKRDIVLLCGELGSGKTVFFKGMARGLGVDEKEATSSSFIIMKEYRLKRLSLYHFDLYRIKNTNEIVRAGLEQELWGEGISVIEWAQRCRDFFKECLQVNISILGKNKRALHFISYGKRYNFILKKIKDEYPCR